MDNELSYAPLTTIPEALYGREPGTWQYLTITERLGITAQRVVEEGSWSPRQEDRLGQLIAELPEGPIRLPEDPQAPDAADWLDYVAPYVGLSWLDVPWFFAEMYFFRRILEATGFFGPGEGEGVDPYAHQKAAGLASAAPALNALVAVSTQPHSSSALRRLLRLDLWGNQADMSIWPASSDSAGPPNASAPERAHLLIDDIPAAVDHAEKARARGPLRIDVLADNAGIELVGDLVTADFLLRHEVAHRVIMHVKPYPTFVSDATIPDVVATIEALASGSLSGNGTATGRRLRHALSDGRLEIRTNVFWTSIRPFWDMPGSLRADLRQSDLLIVKGDMSYRRLHGDRHWPYDTPFETVVWGTPAPLLALRVIKSEVASGLDAELIERTIAEDPEWMTSGRWGMAPFFSP